MEPELAAGHEGWGWGGVSLPPIQTHSPPLSFVFLHFSEWQEEARALKAAFVLQGAGRVSPWDHYTTVLPGETRLDNNCMHLTSQ